MTHAKGYSRLKTAFQRAAIIGSLVMGSLSALQHTQPGENNVTDSMARKLWESLGTPLYLQEKQRQWHATQQQHMTTPETRAVVEPYLAQLDYLRGANIASIALQVDQMVAEDIHYAYDPWYAPDHWQSSFETIRKKRGDCEDNALLKYHLMRYLGVPAEDMRIIAASTNSRGHYVLDHYTLVLKLKENEVILLDDGLTKGEGKYFIFYAMGSEKVEDYKAYQAWKSQPAHYVPSEEYLYKPPAVRNSNSRMGR